MVALTWQSCYLASNCWNESVWSSPSITVADSALIGTNGFAYVYQPPSGDDHDEVDNIVDDMWGLTVESDDDESSSESEEEDEMKPSGTPPPDDTKSNIILFIIIIIIIITIIIIVVVNQLKASVVAMHEWLLQPPPFAIESCPELSGGGHRRKPWPVFDVIFLGLPHFLFPSGDVSMLSFTVGCLLLPQVMVQAILTFLIDDFSFKYFAICFF